MISIKEYAALHGLHRQTVHNMVLQGRIKGAKKIFPAGINSNGVWTIPPKAKISPLNGSK